MKIALLVIDVQEEYVSGKLPITYPLESFDNILKAIDMANGHRIPVILVQHTSLSSDAGTFLKGSPGWELLPELINRPYDHLVEKNLPGSFTGTDLERWLLEREIDTVTIAGFMSQMCCDTTARQAFHRGFGVEFLSDATGTMKVSNYAGEVLGEDLHRSVLVTQAMRFSKVMDTVEWIKELY